MSVNCGPDATALTKQLGFSCTDANPVITLRNPFELASWTQPVFELLIIVGAVLALLHAIRRLRQGEPANLAIWAGSLVYLFFVEPLLYFPEWFGITDFVGFNFSHNVFTVQFMYDRLPLYIVAFYPAVSQLAFEVVRRYGVFVRRGVIVGGVSVAFVFHVFYQIFDQIGPQLTWWAWNLDNPDNQPRLAAVPMNSMWIFSAVTFGVMTALVLWLVQRPTAAGRPPKGSSLAWRIVVVGLGAAVSMPIFALTTAVFGREDPNITAKAIVLTIELAALWIAGTSFMVREWRAGRPAGFESGERTAFDYFPVAYLTVLAVLWVTALPQYFSAVDGWAKSGGMIGNLPYVIACFVAATLVLYGSRRAPQSTPIADHDADRLAAR